MLTYQLNEVTHNAPSISADKIIGWGDVVWHGFGSEVGVVNG